MKMRTILVMLLCGVAFGGQDDVQTPYAEPSEQVYSVSGTADIAEPYEYNGITLLPSDGSKPGDMGYTIFHLRGIEIRSWPIAVCDPRRVLDEYPKAMSAKISLGELTKKIQKARQTVRGLTATIKAKQDALDKMKKRKRPKAFEELTTLKAQLVIFQRTRGGELDGEQKAIRAAMLTAEEDVTTAITRIAKEKGISLVITKTPSQTGPVVLYSDDSLDITDAVLEELNKKDE